MLIELLIIKNSIPLPTTEAVINIMSGGVVVKKSMRSKLFILGLIHAIIFVIEFGVSFRKDSVALLTDAYYNFFVAGIWMLMGSQVSSVMSLPQ